MFTFGTLPVLFCMSKPVSEESPASTGHQAERKQLIERARGHVLTLHSPYFLMTA